MGKRKANSQYKKKKRVFHGNRYVESAETAKAGDKRPANPNNASFVKITSPPKQAKVDSRQPGGLRIIDVSLLCDFIASFQCCPNCSGEIEVHEGDFQGVVSRLAAKCTECDYENSFYTSKRGGGKQKFFTVNRQYALAMMAIGKNRQGAVRFSANMDMPQPVALEPWRQHLIAIRNTTVNVAEVSMRRVANGMKKDRDNSVQDVTVSCDGTWQKRGFSSKNGISTVLTVDAKNSKVIDTEVLTNYCNSCAQKKARLSDEEFKQWYEGHQPKCFINHKGSAGSMEPAGMERIFKRSEKIRRLRYTGYLGDGDSKSYNTVATANPAIYPGKLIEKLECCGHIQKRMGKRLMDTVTKCKNKTYKVGNKTYKGIGGQGRLTQKAITRIQGHYGGAIRNNTGDLSAMKKAVVAIWKHRRRDHSDCGDWCKNMSDSNREKNALPDYVCDEIKPVFDYLSSDDLLQKCLHGGTQNTNESFHNLIWERCPKVTFAGRTRLQLAVADATIVYNDGELARLVIFQILGLSHGHCLQNGLGMIDGKRLQTAYVAGDKAVMKARQSRSIVSKNQKSDPTYSAGSF